MKFNRYDLVLFRFIIVIILLAIVLFLTAISCGKTEIDKVDIYFCENNSAYLVNPQAGVVQQVTNDSNSCNNLKRGIK